MYDDDITTKEHRLETAFCGLLRTAVVLLALQEKMCNIFRTRFYD